MTRLPHLREKNGLTSARVLCISPLFAPVANSEAICGAKMVSALSQAGVDIVVLCCRDYGGTTRANDDSKYWGTASTMIIDVPTPRERSLLPRLVSSARYQTPYSVRWVDAALRMAEKLHNEMAFDLVYSRSLPMCSHVAGYWASTKFRLPWIANINDPLHQCLDLGGKAKKISMQWQTSMFWLKRVMNFADVVTYPSRRLGLYHARLSGIDRPFEVIPHVGYTAEVNARTARGDRNRLRLVHCGKLGNDSNRHPAALLAGLRKFLDSNAATANGIELILVGPADAATEEMIDRFSLRQVVSSVGCVTYEESLSYIASADVCVLVEGNFEEGIYLPSKLTDYITALRPILALSPEIGEIGDIAAEAHIAHVAPSDTDGVAAALERLYSDHVNGKLERRAPPTAIARRFDPSTIAAQFLTAAQAIGSPATIAMAGLVRTE